MDPKEVVQTFVRRVWNERDETAIDELRAPDSRSEGIDEVDVDNEAFRAMHRLACQVFASTEMICEEWVVEGDKVALRARFVVTTADGREGSMSGIGIIRVANGRIAHVRQMLDLSSMNRALGLTQQGPTTMVELIQATAATMNPAFCAE